MGEICDSPTLSVIQKPHQTTVHVNSIPITSPDAAGVLHVLLEELGPRHKLLTGPCYCLLFKAAVSGSSCDHTGSASTTCLPQNGDHYYRFSLTFSKIETEPWVLFTKNNQEDIGNRCASGLELERPDFLSTTAQNRRTEKHFRLFLIESDVASYIYQMVFVVIRPVRRECFNV